jgi:hypothetical protein
MAALYILIFFSARKQNDAEQIVVITHSFNLVHKKASFRSKQLSDCPRRAPMPYALTVQIVRQRASENQIRGQHPTKAEMVGERRKTIKFDSLEPQV